MRVSRERYFARSVELNSGIKIFTSTYFYTTVSNCNFFIVLWPLSPHTPPLTKMQTFINMKIMMMMMIMKHYLNVYGKATCGKCSHEWIPRVEKPLRCPTCGTLRWNKDA